MRQEAAGAAGSALPQWAGGLALLGGFWLMLLLDAFAQRLAAPAALAADGEGEAAASAAAARSQGARGAEAPAAGTDGNSGSVGGGGSFTALQRRGRTVSPPLPPLKSQTKRPGAATMVASPPRASQQQQPVAAAVLEIEPAGSPTAAAADGAAVARRQQLDAADALFAGRGGAVLLGLLVHAAADGLAVGSAALSRARPEASLAVAAAMVLHKLPVAAGLSAFLSALGWPHARVKRAALAFAAASPAAAIASFAALSALAPGGGDGDGGDGAAVALALLVSGGTVLFAATAHVLPEALAAAGGARHDHAGGLHADGDGGGDGANGGHDHERQALLMPSTADGATGAGAATPLSAAAAAQRRREALVWMTAGAALPLLLSATLHHDHHGGAHGG